MHTCKMQGEHTIGADLNVQYDQLRSMCHQRINMLSLRQLHQLRDFMVCRRTASSSCCNEVAEVACCFIEKSGHLLAYREQVACCQLT